MMGVDRWEFEHRSYRPGRRPPEVAPQDETLDLPEDLPVDAPPPKSRRRKADHAPHASPRPNG